MHKADWRKPTTLEDVARDAAERAVHEANRAGFGHVAGRGMFAASDRMKLEGEILSWLQEHMTPEQNDE